MQGTTAAGGLVQRPRSKTPAQGCSEPGPGREDESTPDIGISPGDRVVALILFAFFAILGFALLCDLIAGLSQGRVLPLSQDAAYHETKQFGRTAMNPDDLFGATRSCSSTSAGPTRTPARPVRGRRAGTLPRAAHRRLLRRDRPPPQRPQGHHRRPAQIERLKGTLREWLRELLSGPYDSDYVARRWRVGWRHVEIGLDQVYTNVALSRLRTGLDARPCTSAGRAESSLTLLGRPVRCAQQAARPRPGDHRGRLPGRVHGPAAAQRAAGGHRPGGRRRRPRAAQPAQRRQDLGLLPAQRPQPYPREDGRAPPAHRAPRSSADGVITALSNFAKMPVPNLRPSPSSRACARVLEINPLPGSVQVTVDCPPGPLPPVLGDRTRSASCSAT